MCSVSSHLYRAFGRPRGGILEGQHWRGNWWSKRVSHVLLCSDWPWNRAAAPPSHGWPSKSAYKYFLFILQRQILYSSSWKSKWELKKQRGGGGMQSGGGGREIMLWREMCGMQGTAVNTKESSDVTATGRIAAWEHARISKLPKVAHVFPCISSLWS